MLHLRNHGEGDKRMEVGILLETKKDALISHCVVKGKVGQA